MSVNTAFAISKINFSFLICTDFSKTSQYKKLKVKTTSGFKQKAFLSLL